MRQLDTISENLIIKNMETIVKDGERISNKKVDNLEDMQKVISKQEPALNYLETNFIEKYDTVQKSLNSLKHLYKTKRLANSYYSFVDTVTKLDALLRKKFD